MANDHSIGIDSIVKKVEAKLAEIVRSTPKDLLPKLGQPIFRGESALYQTALLPTLFRLNDVNKEFSEIYLYEEFQRMYPRYSDVCLHELDWLSVMQHYGVPTRLLDWTASLLVALYFATQDVGQSPNVIGNDGVLYYRLVTPERTLNSSLADLLKELVQIRYEKDLEDWSVKWPSREGYAIADSFLYRPKQLHDRLKSQHGLFTINIGKTVNDVSNRVLNITRLISPNLSYLENEGLIKKFIEKIDFYWGKYSSEEDLDKNIFEAKEIIGRDFRNYKSPIYVLMLISEETARITVYISTINIKIYSLLARPTLRLDNVTKLVLEKKDKISMDLIYSILITALRAANPLIATKVLNFIEGNAKEELINKEFTPPDIHKIIIPADQKKALRKHLAVMGISHNTLFPEPSNFFQGLNERFYDLSELAKEKDIVSNVG